MWVEGVTSANWIWVLLPFPNFYLKNCFWIILWNFLQRRVQVSLRWCRWSSSPFAFALGAEPPAMRTRVGDELRVVQTSLSCAASRGRKGKIHQGTARCVGCYTALGRVGLNFQQAFWQLWCSSSTLHKEQANRTPEANDPAGIHPVLKWF